MGTLGAEELSPLVDVSVLTGMVRQYGFPTLLQSGTYGPAHPAPGDGTFRVAGCSKLL
ncbi:Uncharacterised protein [Mycobacteroides abscessus subsp. abscessus]|uniref:Uncharacterized protein n=2 Tax=Mycobacteroides abscessus subsp. bolletii TaxID=319705 RepID=A0A829HWX3_9MYCO|nr:hypothetical protein MASS_2988 [Mycobacteroides abscessus subsp. bolletii 50594]EPQ23276.1 hypothetical protein J108_14170 [Mycobacteroides abscessus subsp. bolletii CRM-0020]BBZ80383.1 hypothetical protein MABM_02990 [Mycobacteroides abscessus]SHW06487.1 Uncharacterised protein [Mycobacteroides abscessus subsp. abscessus]SIL92101.1 Uncharacterised protein [Mycobacteroides abscessus subsp. abscessus]